MKGLIMLNKIKNLVSKNETKKLTVANQINDYVNDISNTINKVLEMRENAYKGFLDSLIPELAIGDYVEQLDIKASKQKNRNKWKHNELAKNGFGKHTTNEKNQSKFEYTIFTKQELNIRKQASKHATRFVEYCKTKQFTSFVYAYQSFQKDILSLHENKKDSKAPSHKRKIEKQSKQKTKQKIVKVLPNKTLVLEYASQLTSSKDYKDRNFETCVNDAFYFLELICHENGIDFNKFMKVKQNNGLETLKKVFKIA
jgi:hypothetical protein